MEFRILGALEALNEHGTVALGGIKPRAVLAYLLLHAGEPVNTERLAVALWGEDAPAAALETVQVHVSRLRKALGDPPSSPPLPPATASGCVPAISTPNALPASSMKTPSARRG